jgi:two-component system, NtrC family, response regulator AtoC
MDLLDAALALPEPPVAIMMTAYGSVDTAVEAMRRGAWHFVTKPLNLDEVEMLLKRACAAATSKPENQQLTQQVKKSHKLDRLIGKSPEIRRVSEMIQQVAPTRATILIEGERHRQGSGRPRAAPPVRPAGGEDGHVHCAALSPQLLESELFGHEKGPSPAPPSAGSAASSRRTAARCSSMRSARSTPPPRSSCCACSPSGRIERVGSNTPIKVDVRVIAATNKNLRELVDRGDFREDLYFRLNVVRIEMPPLRTRREDIVLLANAFLRSSPRKTSARSNRSPTPRSSCCAPTRGRATCANCAPPSSTAW